MQKEIKMKNIQRMIICQNGLQQFQTEIISNKKIITSNYYILQGQKTNDEIKVSESNLLPHFYSEYNIFNNNQQFDVLQEQKVPLWILVWQIQSLSTMQMNFLLEVSQDKHSVQNNKEIGVFLNEQEQSCENQNLLKAFGIFQNETEIYQVIEQCDMTLKHYLKQAHTKIQILQIFGQIYQGYIQLTKLVKNFQGKSKYDIEDLELNFDNIFIKGQLVKIIPFVKFKKIQMNLNQKMGVILYQILYGEINHLPTNFEILKMIKNKIKNVQNKSKISILTLIQNLFEQKCQHHQIPVFIKNFIEIFQQGNYNMENEDKQLDIQLKYNKINQQKIKQNHELNNQQQINNQILHNKQVNVQLNEINQQKIKQDHELNNEQQINNQILHNKQTNVQLNEINQQMMKQNSQLNKGLIMNNQNSNFNNVIIVNQDCQHNQQINNTNKIVQVDKNMAKFDLSNQLKIAKIIINDEHRTSKKIIQPVGESFIQMHSNSSILSDNKLTKSCPVRLQNFQQIMSKQIQSLYDVGQKNFDIKKICYQKISYKVNLNQYANAIQQDNADKNKEDQDKFQKDIIKEKFRLQIKNNTLHSDCNKSSFHDNNITKSTDIDLNQQKLQISNQQQQNNLIDFYFESQEKLTSKFKNSKMISVVQKEIVNDTDNSIYQFVEQNEVILNKEQQQEYQENTNQTNKNDCFQQQFQEFMQQIIENQVEVRQNNQININKSGQLQNSLKQFDEQQQEFLNDDDELKQQHQILQKIDQVYIKDDEIDECCSIYDLNLDQDVKIDSQNKKTKIKMIINKIYIFFKRVIAPFQCSKNINESKEIQINNNN